MLLKIFLWTERGVTWLTKRQKNSLDMVLNGGLKITNKIKVYSDMNASIQKTTSVVQEDKSVSLPELCLQLTAHDMYTGT